MAVSAQKHIPDTTVSEPSVARGSASGPMRNYTDRADAPAKIRISDAIRHDHRELKAYYDSIIKSTNPDEQTRFQNQFTWELARHSVGEELVVYPAFEKYLRGGEEMAERDRLEHQGVKDQLKVFQELKATDPRFIPTLKALMEDLSHHIEEEERIDMPRLDEELSRDESVDLTRSFARTKMFVPTRSHPMAPSKPPFETAIGLMTAPIDSLADMFRKWPRQPTE